VCEGVLAADALARVERQQLLHEVTRAWAGVRVELRHEHRLRVGDLRGERKKEKEKERQGSEVCWVSFEQKERESRKQIKRRGVGGG
jgi:hypothetical protein